MSPIETRYLFTMPMKVERQTLGRTPLGDRMVVIVTEARIDGPKLKAQLLKGSSDWVIQAPDGTFHMDCRMVFHTDAGELFGMTYQGRRQSAPEGTDPAAVYHRVLVSFETAAPRLDWLNRIVAVGRARRNPDGLSSTYEMFEVL
jgi:hypothetical protein